MARVMWNQCNQCLHRLPLALRFCHLSRHLCPYKSPAEQLSFRMRPSAPRSTGTMRAASCNVTGYKKVADSQVDGPKTRRHGDSPHKYNLYRKLGVTELGHIPTTAGCGCLDSNRCADVREIQTMHSQCTTITRLRDRYHKNISATTSQLRIPGRDLLSVHEGIAATRSRSDGSRNPTSAADRFPCFRYYTRVGVFS